MKLRNNDLPIASLTFKINNVTLFQETLENKVKLKRGFRIKNLILEKKEAYLKKIQNKDPKDNCKKYTHFKTLFNHSHQDYHQYSFL